MVMLVSWSGHVSWTEKNSGKLQLAVCRDWSYHLLLQHAALCHLAISDNLMHRLPVDPERCHSVGDRHSAIRPHLASFPPAALPSVVIEHRVWGHHSGQTGTMPVWASGWWLMPYHQWMPAQEDCAWLKLVLYLSVQLQWQSRQCSWILGLELYSSGPQTDGLVTTQFRQALKAFLFGLFAESAA